MNDVHPELHGAIFNPLDLVERLAAGNEWACQRHSEDELSLELKGQWCRYEVWLSWHADLGVLQIACMLDLEIPARRLTQAVSLLALANEKLLLGHFELGGEERRPAFRYALLFRDGVVPGPELLEEVFELNMALDELRGGDLEVLPQLEVMRRNFLEMLAAIDTELEALFARHDAAPPEGRKQVLAEIRSTLNRRRYISNLVQEVDKQLTARNA